MQFNDVEGEFEEVLKEDECNSAKDSHYRMDEKVEH